MKLNIIYNEDCLETMRRMPDDSVSLVLTDPPYGITSNKWDIVTAFMEEALRVSPLVVMTAGQPYSSLVVCEYLKYFKHEWIWSKNAGSNFANTVREPMKEHEQVLIFSKNSKWTYNRQMQARAATGLSRVKTPVKFETSSDNYRVFERVDTKIMPELRVPSSIQRFNRERGFHPTQKPVSLMRYMVETYSNEGDIIYDPFMGSGTTAIAAREVGRHYIGSEVSKQYCEIAEKRLAQTVLL